tara:strand:+ start:347 stop:823 length:477 start_codon:yes stop_codon:yes gene_type:complete
MQQYTERDYKMRKFHDDHSERLNSIVHKRGLGTLVPLDPNELDHAIYKDKESLANFDHWMNQIDNSRVSDRRKSMRRNLLKKKIVDHYLTRFIKNRIEYKEETAFKIKEWAETHSIPEETEDEMEYAYKHFDGWRKFSYSQAGYDFYLETGKEPWSIA